MQHHIQLGVFRTLILGAFFSLLFILGSTQVFAQQIATITDNVDSSEIQTKVLKIKGKNGIIRHSGKKGTVIFNSKATFKKKATLNQPLNAKKNIYNSKGAVTVQDDLTVSGLINGVDISALQTTVDALEIANIAYTAGSGLTLTGTSFSLLTTCASGEVLKYNGSAWACAADADTADTNTTYSAGTGIDISSTVVSATLGTSIDTSEIDANTITDSDIDLSGNWTITGNFVNTTNPWADNEVADALTISGGTIDDSTIGATTESTGNFTHLQVYDAGIETNLRQQLPRAGTTAVIDATVDSPTPPLSVKPSAIVNNNGTLLIAYHDGGDNGTLKMATCPVESSICATPTIVEVDSTADSGYFASIALDPTTGLPLIAHFDNTGRNVILNICTNASCSSSTRVVVAEPGTVGYGLSLTLTSTGFPIMSYTDATNLIVAACDDAACATSTKTTVQASDASASIFATSIALNPNSGFPNIAYVDVNNDISLAQCTTATCSTDTTVIMDAIISAEDVSLTMSGDGFPVVAYVDGTDLKTAACTTTGCAEANATLTTVSTTAGAYVSATTGTDGFPVIAYESNVTDNLEAIKCGSVNCATNSAAITVDAGAVDNVAVAISYDGRPIIAFNETTGSGSLEVYQAANKFITDYFFTR